MMLDLRNSSAAGKVTVSMAPCVTVITSVFPPAGSTPSAAYKADIDY